MNLHWWSDVLGGRTFEQKVLYEPSSSRIVEAMLALAGVGPGDTVYDLGCGDGRVVIEAAQRGARGVGIDIDPVRIEECWANMITSGTADRVSFMEGDLYSADFSESTVLMLYLLPEANIRLRPKIFKTMRPGARVVSHSHDMGDWEPDRKTIVQGHGIYCWIIPENARGTWEWTAPSASGKDETVRLKIEQKFQKLWGALDIRGTRSLLLGEPEIRGSHIRLTTVQRWKKKTLTACMDGEIKGDEITGRMLVRKETGLKRAPWRAGRSAADAIR